MPGKRRRNTPAVFLGNLRTNIRIGLLKDNIINLFHLVRINYIRKKHIAIIKRPYATFCFVTLRTDEEAECAVSNFDDLFYRDAIPHYILVNVIEPGLPFKVGLRTDFGGLM